MSAGEVVRIALVAGLAASGAFGGIEGLVREAGPGVLPRVAVGVAQASDWGTKTEAGRELRTAIVVRVAAGQVGRLDALVAAAEAAGVALQGALGGWRVASAVLLRTRVTEEKSGVRVATVEHRVRVLASG